VRRAGRGQSIFGQAGGGFGFGGVGDLDLVLDGYCASAFGETRGNAFVLDDVGFAFEDGDSVMDGDGEVVGEADLRFGELRADVAFDYGVGEEALLGCGFRGGRAGSGRRG